MVLCRLLSEPRLLVEPFYRVGFLGPRYTIAIFTTCTDTYFTFRVIAMDFFHVFQARAWKMAAIPLSIKNDVIFRLAETRRPTYPYVRVGYCGTQTTMRLLMVCKGTWAEFRNLARDFHLAFLGRMVDRAEEEELDEQLRWHDAVQRYGYPLQHRLAWHISIFGQARLGDRDYIREHFVMDHME